MNTIVLLLFRIGAFISHVSDNLSKENKSANEKEKDFFSEEGFIEDQSLLTFLSIGNHPVSYSGCGVIAVYNALLSLNLFPGKIGFFDLITVFEKSGLVFKGKYGISPYSIYRYLKNNGYKADAIVTSDFQKIDLFSKGYDCFISIFYNKDKNIKNGLHYVAISKSEDEKYLSHNPSKIGDSLSDAILSASYNAGRPLYTIGIKND